MFQSDRYFSERQITTVTAPKPANFLDATSTDSNRGVSSRCNPDTDYSCAVLRKLDLLKCTAFVQLVFHSCSSGSLSLSGSLQVICPQFRPALSLDDRGHLISIATTDDHLIPAMPAYGIIKPLYQMY